MEKHYFHGGSVFTRWRGNIAIEEWHDKLGYRVAIEPRLQNGRVYSGLIFNTLSQALNYAKGVNND